MPDLNSRLFVPCLPVDSPLAALGSSLHDLAFLAMLCDVTFVVAPDPSCATCASETKTYSRRVASASVEALADAIALLKGGQCRPACQRA